MDKHKDEVDDEEVGSQAAKQVRSQSSDPILVIPFPDTIAAFRERATGRTFNRDQSTGEGTETGVRPGRDSGPGTRRAGRGPRGPRRGGDRHSRTGIR